MCGDRFAFCHRLHFGGDPVTSASGQDKSKNSALILISRALRRETWSSRCDSNGIRRGGAVRGWRSACRYPARLKAVAVDLRLIRIAAFTGGINFGHRWIRSGACSGNGQAIIFSVRPAGI